MIRYVILSKKDSFRKWKITPMYLTFTLIINLTPDFKKYSAILLHLKRRTSKYPHHLKT